MLFAHLLRPIPFRSRRATPRGSPDCSRPWLEALEERYLLTISEFPTPTSLSVPAFLTPGPDGNVWFTELNANKIAQVTPDGVLTEFPIRAANFGPLGITTGPDGNLWFTEFIANKIGRILPDGTQLTEFPIPTPVSGPTQIIAGPDGNLWFIEANAYQIAKLDPVTGRVIEFPAFSSQNATVDHNASLTFGPDGNVWFAEHSVNRIGRLTPDGSQVLELPLPTPGSGPVGITAAADGMLWFTEYDANQIARMDPYTFSIEEFPIPTPNSGPVELTSGLDGNLWFTEYKANKLGRITPAGSVADYTIPTGNSAPLSITSGPDANLWFTESNSHKIGRYFLPLPATHFVVDAVSRCTAGSPFAVGLTALDAAHRIVRDYAGTVHFTSSDPYPGMLPGEYTFTAEDHGVHTFSEVILYSGGLQTLTAQDTVNSSLSGLVAISVQSLPADHFVIEAPSTAVAGSSFAITITALDPYGNVDTNYQGTVTFTSSDTDAGVLLPADYTFQATDFGTHTFPGSITLVTPGEESLTATGTASGASGSATVTVSSPAVPPREGPSVPRTPTMTTMKTLTPDRQSADQVALRERFFRLLTEEEFARTLPLRSRQHALEPWLLTVLAVQGLDAWPDLHSHDRQPV
jgi:streptogramin lyase